MNPACFPWRHLLLTTALFSPALAQNSPPQDIGAVEAKAAPQDGQVFTYVGREPDAAWRREALARIERVRKSELTIVVRDSAGQLVPDARVTVEQTRSAFQWGTAVRPHLLGETGVDAERYRTTLRSHFTSASDEMGLKWYSWLGERGPLYARDHTMAGLRWLKEHDFHVRGHVFVWPSWRRSPEDIKGLVGTARQSEIPDRVLAHIRTLADETRGLTHEWDVVNETYRNHDYLDVFGRDIMLSWFAAAAEALPGVPLYLNDFGNHNQVTDPAHVADFETTAQFLLERGAELHGLGLQAHFGRDPGNPTDVLATLDRLAKLKLPIRFTEFDVWTDDEALQADFTRDFLILAFSHPQVVGVQLWGFWAGTHWRPNAAMFRQDWSEKPNGKIYRDLVLTQWRTRLSLTTNPQGEATARAFHGDYLIRIDHQGRTSEHRFTLTPEKRRFQVVAARSGSSR